MTARMECSLLLPSVRDGSFAERSDDEGEPSVDLDEAEKFIGLFHEENPGAGPVERRLREVRVAVEQTGTYVHTGEELAFGARVAWRNSSRCIGRLYWHSLQVRDCRRVRTAEGVFAELVEHLRMTTNAGRIRPMITIFAPRSPSGAPVRIWNEQLIRYAGYRRADGSVVGDPRYVDFTDAMRRSGWRGAGSAFDLLPVVVEVAGRSTELFELPRDAVLEVPITHPTLPWFAELGLRWHAVPAISNMTLEVGGVSYPAAPFNGWYMGTEIGARNLADAGRYNLLPEVARRLGLDTSSDRSLWKDIALVVVNVAVLWSFDQAGATVTDHHTESQRFLLHVAREERAGRIVPADWSWIVPPMSSSTTGVFHRYYDDADLRPNFRYDEEAAQLARTGTRTCPRADS